MPIMAKSNDEYTEVKAIKTPNGTEIDYVLSKVDNTYKRTYTAIRELEVTPPLEFKSIKPQANLLDYRIYGQTSRNLFDAEIVQGGLTGATGAEFDSDNRCRSSYILLGAGTYTISISSSHTIGLFIFSSTNVFETFVSYSDSSITFSLETVKKVRFGFSTRYGDGSITPSDISSIMLNTGSEPLPYEPYGESVGDRTGNLFDEELTDAYHLDSTTGLPVGHDDRFATLQPITINQGEYCLTYNSTTDLRFMYSVFNDDTLIRRVAIINNRYLQSGDAIDTTGGNKIYFAFYNNNCSHASTGMISNIMLNVGSTPLPYEPYGYKVPVTVSNGIDTLTTPIYLPEQIKKVGDEAEYIDYSEQKIVSKINRYELSYDGEWQYQLAANNYISWILNNISLPIRHNGVGFVDTVNFKCNILNESQTGAASVNSNQLAIYYTPSGKCVLDVRLSTSLAATIEEFKDWLQNNNVFFDYVYANSIETTVTLPALPTLSGTNTLTVGTEVQPSDMYIKGNFKMIAGGGE